MKIQDKKIDNKTYYKYRINLPKEVVKKSGLLNQDIKISNKGGKIILEKKVTY